MSAVEPLILFSRTDCHLCELAIAMLQRTGTAWRPVDIDGDPELVGRYGNQVPVLRHPESGRELYFPFNDKQVLEFVRGKA